MNKNLLHNILDVLVIISIIVDKGSYIITRIMDIFKGGDNK